MKSNRRSRRALGPTRLMAAWVVLGGSVAGLALAAILMPPPAPAEPPIWVQLPSAPDRYAATDALFGSTRPEENPEALAALDVGLTPEALAEPAVARRSSAPVLTLTPVDAGDVPFLPIGDDDEDGGPDEVVITMSGGASPSGKPVKATGPLPPDPSLMAASGSGKRPAIARDGRTPLSTYRRPAHRLASAPTASLSVMLSGLGLDPVATERALESLPPDVTLSFAPYSRDLEGLIARATAKGHEVALELPMEQGTASETALGTAALMTTRTVEANAKRLEWILARAPAYPLVTNYLGRTFSADRDALQPILADVKSAGLGYLDDTGLAAGLATEMGLPYAAISAVIPPGTTDVAARLSQLAGVASDTPTIVKVYAADGGLDGVIAFVQSDARKAITLVPASAAIRQP